MFTLNSIQKSRQTLLQDFQRVAGYQDIQIDLLIRFASGFSHSMNKINFQLFFVFRHIPQSIGSMQNSIFEQPRVLMPCLVFFKFLTNGRIFAATLCLFPGCLKF